MKIIAVFALALFVFGASPAFADIDSADLLDNVLQRYSSAAAGWAGVITAAASWLFWCLATISMVWTFGFMILRKADLGEFFAEFIRFTIFTGFFWWLLTNGPNFADSIIRSLRIIGGNATGLGGDLRPSGVVDVGFEIFETVLDRSTVWNPVDSTVGILLALVILVVLALIGVNMLLLLVSGWILMYAGIFFLGFGGSRWTSDMAIGYYKTVLCIAAQLFTMVLIVGIGQTFLNDYYSQMNAGVRLSEMGVMLIVAVVLLVLVDKVPSMIGQLSFGGGGSGGVGTFGAGMAMGVAGAVAAGAATAGALALAGASNMAGGAQAIKAAFSKAGANVAAGTDILSSFGGGAGSSSAPMPGGGSDQSNGESSVGMTGGGSGESGGAGATASATNESGGAASEAGGGVDTTPPQGNAFSRAVTGAGRAAAGAAATAGRATKAAVALTGRIGADVTANLAKGTAAVAMGKVRAAAGNTVGGKIAEAIRGEGETTFDGDSLQADPEKEVAAFVQRGTPAARGAFIEDALDEKDILNRKA